MLFFAFFHTSESILTLTLIMRLF